MQYVRFLTSELKYLSENFLHLLTHSRLASPFGLEPIPRIESQAAHKLSSHNFNATSINPPTKIAPSP